MLSPPEDLRNQRKAGLILAGFFLLEGFFVLPDLVRHTLPVLARLGLAPGHHLALPLGWVLAALVTALYVWWSQRLPSVRANLVRPSWLKLLALGVAVVAGILEEYFFRGMVMDWLLGLGWGGFVQVFATGLTFGLAHGIWGLFKGSLRAGIGATVATGVLGALLGIVYLAGGRSLGPCVASHFAINAFAEPGLVLAALRGEMGRAMRSD